MKRILLARLQRLQNPTAVQAAHWATSVLVVAIGVTLAQLTWRVLPRPIASGTPPAIFPGSTSPATAPAQRFSAVAGLHLFGQAAVAGSQIQAPETHLNFTLHGLFASNAPSDSFAIIAGGNGVELTYRVGDKIGGATIHDILPNRVILERSGHYETLKLPKSRLDIATTGANDSGSTGRRLNPDAARQFNELRKNILGNPQKLFDLATFEPVFSNGQLLGYRILPRAHVQLFKDAGLSPSDIITEINGITVTDPSQLGAITEQLSNATSLQIGVEHPDGSHDAISINLN